MHVMMDHKERKSLHEEEKNIETENKRCCTDCKTTKTPLWRGGPAGPKSLCNACGIRYRKKRKAIMGLVKGPGKKKEGLSTATTNGTGTVNGLSESFKMSLMVLGKNVILQRSSVVKKQRCQRKRKLTGEEEQAAFSLMALSCGAVFG